MRRLSFDFCHKKNTFAVVSPTSPLYPPFRGGYLGVARSWGLQRRRRLCSACASQTKDERQRAKVKWQKRGLRSRKGIERASQSKDVCHET